MAADFESEQPEERYIQFVENCEYTEQGHEDAIMQHWSRRAARIVAVLFAVFCVAAAALADPDEMHPPREIHGKFLPLQSFEHQQAQALQTLAGTGGSEGAKKLKPVILMHGAAQAAADFRHIGKWIQDVNPGTTVFALRIYEGAESFTPLAEQLDGILKLLRALVKEQHDIFSGGYNLLCHSQGALLCRALCEYMDDHKVVSFISLAGPHMGVFGQTWLDNAKTFLQSQLPIPDVPIPLPGFGSLGISARDEFYLVAYTTLMQSATSLANLWNDPLHHDAYLQGNTFLPQVNCQGDAEADLARRRSNFLRLERAVFLVGSFQDRPYDSPLGLEPWQSGIFGFYADGSDDKIVPMEHQDFFQNDTFGLRTLHSTGRLHLNAVPGVGHQDWLTSHDVFVRYVLPQLM